MSTLSFFMVFILSLKHAIRKSYQNIMDIKLQFWYTILLNNLVCIDAVIFIFIQLFYENIGPKNAFEIWWYMYLFENLGKGSPSKKNFVKRVCVRHTYQKKLDQ